MRCCQSGSLEEVVVGCEELEGRDERWRISLADDGRDDGVGSASYRDSSEKLQAKAGEDVRNVTKI